MKTQALDSGGLIPGKRAENCAPPKGILMVIGGKENKGQKPDPGSYQQSLEHFEQLQILKKFVALTNKPDPAILVITTASTEPEAAFADYKAAFAKLGLLKITHLHDQSRKAALSNTTQKLAKADAIIISGGDQLRLTSVYGGTPQLALLKKRFQEEQLVLAGTSAGAMAFSGPMIFQAAHTIDVLKGEVQLTAGFGFLDWASIDTHFMERGRLSRLVQVLATNPSFTGIGIEEDTGIIVRNGAEFEVVGSGTVLILEGQKSHCANIAEVANGNPVSIRDLQLHLLVSGDKYLRPEDNIRTVQTGKISE